METPLSTVIKTLRILQTFSEDRPELGVMEISRILRLHKSSVSRIVSSLASEGFLEKSHSTSKYRLGLKLIGLAHLVLKGCDLRDHARPLMDELAKRSGEIVHLSVLDKNDIVYLEKQGEGQGLTVGSRIGGRNPAHASAMGKVLLAGKSKEELLKTLSAGSLVKCTPNTITHLANLLKELEKVRKKGYATDDEESFLGIRCVAAPVCDSEGRVVAAVSVTAPKERMGRERMKEMVKEIVALARAISTRIGMKRG